MQKARRGQSRAGKEDLVTILLGYRVNAFAVLPLVGGDGESHLLAQSAANKAAHGMGLPVGRGHDFPQRGTAGLLQQIQHLRGLAAAARSGRLCLLARGFARLRPLGRVR